MRYLTESLEYSISTPYQWHFSIEQLYSDNSRYIRGIVEENLLEVGVIISDAQLCRLS